MKRKNLRVKTAEVYIKGRELREQERASDWPKYNAGEPGGPNLVNKEIEAEGYRQHFAEDDVEICISVQPGDEELGQIFINVQLEGKSGKGMPPDAALEQYNKCIEKQGQFLQQTTDLLAEFLGQFDGEWEVDLAAQPCPKATREIELDVVAHKLDQTVRIEAKRRVDVRPTRSVEVKNKL